MNVSTTPVLKERYLPPFEMLLRPDNIIVAKVLPGTKHIDKDSLVSLRETVKDWGGGKRMRVIIHIHSFTLITNEAKHYSASEEAGKFTLANALIVNSTAERIASNFYILFTKPVRPTKIFSNVNQAVDWLMSLKDD